MIDKYLDEKGIKYSKIYTNKEYVRLFPHEIAIWIMKGKKADAVIFPILKRNFYPAAIASSIDKIIAGEETPEFKTCCFWLQRDGGFVIKPFKKQFRNYKKAIVVLEETDIIMDLIPKILKLTEELNINILSFAIISGLKEEE